jgi:hypothetical protein
MKRDQLPNISSQLRTSNKRKACNMCRTIRVSLTALTIALAFSATSTSRAGFSVELTSIVPVGPNFQYNYDVIFETLPGRGRVEVGSGMLNPGTIGSQDFVTIYDVGLSGTEFLSATAGPGFSVGSTLIGFDAAQTFPTDHPVLSNVTFRYTGPPATVSADTVFTGFSIVSILGPTGVTPMRIGQYTTQNTDNSGADGNLKISQLGPVEVPPTLIPEPGTWALSLIGCIGCLAMCRLRHQRRGQDD